MSKLKKIILGLILLSTAQTKTAAGRFARSAWKFIKRPAMVLGMGGSIGSFVHIKHATKQIFTELGEQAQQQAADEELEAKKEELKKFCKDTKGISVNHMVYDAMGIAGNSFKLSGAAAQTHNGKSLILLGDEFKPESTTPQELQHFLLGHESVHIERDDLSTRFAVRAATGPLSITLPWTLARLSGRGKIVASLSAIAGGFTGAQIRKSLAHFQEFRADKEASSNPKILDAGAEFYKTHAILQENIAEEVNTYGSPEEKRHFAIVSTIAESMHPDSRERVERLREQAAKLRAEQEKTQ